MGDGLDRSKQLKDQFDQRGSSSRPANPDRLDLERAPPRALEHRLPPSLYQGEADPPSFDNLVLSSSEEDGGPGPKAQKKGDLLLALSCWSQPGRNIGGLWVGGRQFAQRSS